MKKCEYCKNLDEMEREYPKAVHKGAVIMCDECGAEYYQQHERDALATNKQASINHPELEKLYGQHQKETI